MNKTFASLGINASLVEALTNQHITEPTAVQEQAVPAALKGLISSSRHKPVQVKPWLFFYRFSKV